MIFVGTVAKTNCRGFTRVTITFLYKSTYRNLAFVVSALQIDMTKQCGEQMSLSPTHVTKIKTNISASEQEPKPFYLITADGRYVFHVGKGGDAKKYGNITLINQQLAKKKWADIFPVSAKLVAGTAQLVGGTLQLQIQIKKKGGKSDLKTGLNQLKKLLGIKDYEIMASANKNKRKIDGAEAEPSASKNDKYLAFLEGAQSTGLQNLDDEQLDKAFRASEKFSGDKPDWYDDFVASIVEEQERRDVQESFLTEEAELAKIRPILQKIRQQYDTYKAELAAFQQLPAQQAHSEETMRAKGTLLNEMIRLRAELKEQQRMIMAMEQSR